MPQASEELRGIIRQRFGSLDIEGPLSFLRKHGFTESAGYICVPENHLCTVEEIECIDFLVEEWDFWG